MAYEVVIGLEAHAQLLTASKMFCGCSTAFGAAPNTQTCPVCLGMPGVLPVINQKAVEFAIRTGLALNCTIAPMNRFARKNYFYPDLPKGYQISQYELPICQDGWVEIGENGTAKRSEEHTSELQSPCNLVCRLLLEKKKKNPTNTRCDNGIEHTVHTR